MLALHVNIQICCSILCQYVLRCAWYYEGAQTSSRRVSQVDGSGLLVPPFANKCFAMSLKKLCPRLSAMLWPPCIAQHVGCEVL